MAKVPHIILSSKFSYAETNGKATNDYGRYSTNYMARREALESRAFLTPEEETILLQRQFTLDQKNKVDLIKLSQTYSNKNFDKTKNKLVKENKIELDKTNFIDFTNQDYGKYIGYMMRKQALSDKKERIGLTLPEEKELARVTVGAAHYATPTVGKNKILQGYFSCNQDQIRLKDVENIRNTMRKAQAHHSILWQDVISFDNEYLRKIGVFDPTTSFLDESVLRKASKKMMSVLAEDEQLNNPFWTASIHRNTDNIHIHFGIVEASNSRPIKKYRDNKGILHVEPQGRRKFTTISDMKHAFSATMFNNSQLLKDMNIKRNRITAAIGNNIDRASENNAAYQKKLNEFVQALPSEKSKWHWANLNRKQRTQLTNLVDIAMNDNKDYQEWNKLFSDYQKYYKDMYGVSQSDKKNNAVKKWEDMKRRAGNAMLTDIRNRTKNINNLNIKSKKLSSKHNDKSVHKRRSNNYNYKSPPKVQQQLRLIFNKKNEQKSYKKRKSFSSSNYVNWQKIYQYNRKYRKRQYQHLRREIRPIFNRKASNRSYYEVQRTITKTLTTFEKTQALKVYAEMQHDIETEQERR